MIVKAIEIRDRHTFIPAIVIGMKPANEAQRYLLGRVGFRDQGVVLMKLIDQKAHFYPYDWGPAERTMPRAHQWLEEHFAEISDGDVVDVEFILGETPRPKPPERGGM